MSTEPDMVKHLCEKLKTIEDENARIRAEIQAKTDEQHRHVIAYMHRYMTTDFWLAYVNSLLVTAVVACSQCSVLSFSISSANQTRPSDETTVSSATDRSS